MDSFPNATPTLLSALDAACPKWRAMSPEAFDAFRRSLPDRISASIRLAVAREVLGIPFKSNRQLKAHSDRQPRGDDSVSNLLNEVLTPLWGEGPDSFFLNENFAENEGTWSFPTLRAYDEADHWFQERHRVDREGGTPPARPYSGRMLWDWARWIEGGRLVYGTLSVAASRLSAELDDVMGDAVDAAFPHTLRFERTGGGKGFVTTKTVTEPRDVAERAMATRAVGWERLNMLADARWKPHFLAEDAWVIAVRNDVPGERNLEVTFSGPSALDRVRPTAWVADLAALPDGTERYDAYAKAERASYEAWLGETIERARGLEPAEIRKLA
jgi:hypothetical protein